MYIHLCMYECPCMCVCVCVCVRVRAYIYVEICEKEREYVVVGECVWVRVCSNYNSCTSYICTYIRVYIYIYMYAYVYNSICLYIYTYLYIYAYMYIYIYTYINMYIYIYLYVNLFMRISNKYIRTQKKRCAFLDAPDFVACNRFCVLFFLKTNNLLYSLPFAQTRNLFFAGEHTSEKYYGTLHGAVFEGQVRNI